MYQTLLSIFIPPLAIRRYGEAACCIYPISAIWLGGLVLWGYHFLYPHHYNPLTDQGSLYGGLALVLIAIFWTRLTLRRVETDEKQNGKTSSSRVIPNPNEPDPLEEVAKAKKK